MCVIHDLRAPWYCRLTLGFLMWHDFRGKLVRIHYHIPANWRKSPPQAGISIDRGGALGRPSGRVPAFLEAV